MSDDGKFMVNHLTRVTLRLVEEPLPYAVVVTAGAPTPASVRAFGERLQARAGRVAAMMAALTDKGFSFSFAKDKVFADSREMEAQDAKRYLLAQGFEDSEFQVMLEYARKWEVL